MKWEKFELEVILINILMNHLKRPTISMKLF